MSQPEVNTAPKEQPVKENLFLKLKKNRLAYLFILPAMLAMIILVFYPLALGISYSFTNMNQYNMGSKFVEPSYKYVGLDNYITIFTDPDSLFWPVFKQTIIWTFTNVSLHFLIGLSLALVLNRQIRGRTIYRMILLVPWAVPSFVSAFSWRWMFNYDYGLFNWLLAKIGVQPIPWLSDPLWATVAVIMTNVWLGVPFMMVVLLGGLQSIPGELYEAARVDGASRVQQFFKITLPLLKPVAFTVTLLGIIWTFNMFNIIYLVSEGGPYNSTQILVTYAYVEAFQNWNFGISTTYGVIILSILISFSVVYSRVLKMSSGEKVY